MPIVVIDDQNFTPGENLRGLGYKITQLADVKRVQDVADFRIVLCDLMGVGRAFGEAKQGAGIIEEIRSHYPATIVVAYSGSSLGSAPARAAKLFADKLLKKDLDVSEWKDTLDQLARQALDPHYIWLRTRERLVAGGVDTKDVIVLEDAYVRGIVKGDVGASRLARAISDLDLGQDVRAILQGLIGSAIFKLLVGG